MKNLKLYAIIVAVLLLVISGSAIMVQQSLASGGKSIVITQAGVFKKTAFTQELFSIDSPGSCKLDDQRFTACAPTQGAYFSPGAKGIMSHYWVDSWGTQTSCAGWLQYFGCYDTFAKNGCEVLNSGTCPGDPADSNDVECVLDSDCNSAPSQYCYSGKCKTSTTGECSNGIYKCNDGQVYRCDGSGQYHWYGDCTYLSAKAGSCVSDEATNIAPRLLCKNDPEAPLYEIQLADAEEQGWTAGDVLCKSDSICKGSATCSDGLCVPITIVDGEKCIDCMTPPRPITEAKALEGTECKPDTDYSWWTHNCANGQVIHPLKCIGGKVNFTAEKCQDIGDPSWLVIYWNLYKGWIVAALIGVAALLFLVLVPDKKQRK